MAMLVIMGMLFWMPRNKNFASEVFLPPFLLIVSALQMVSFAFGPAIPWKKTVKQPAVVTHQAMAWRENTPFFRSEEKQDPIRIMRIHGNVRFQSIFLGLLCIQNISKCLLPLNVRSIMIWQRAPFRNSACRPSAGGSQQVMMLDFKFTATWRPIEPWTWSDVQISWYRMN